VGSSSLTPGTRTYDDKEKLLTLGCEDDYDHLPHKIKHAVSAALQQFDPDFIIKVDDDVFVHNDLLLEYVARSRDARAYEGRTIKNEVGYLSSWGIEKFKLKKNREPEFVEPGSYCAGPMYYLGKEASKIIAEHMDPEFSKFEDYNIGKTLRDHGILPATTNLFYDEIQPFLDRQAIAWHDVFHVFKNGVVRDSASNVVCLLKQTFDELEKQADEQIKALELEEVYDARVILRKL